MAVTAQHELFREVLGHDERLFSAFLGHQLRREVARNLFRGDGAPDDAFSRIDTGDANPGDQGLEPPDDATGPFFPFCEPGFALDAVRLENSLHGPLESILMSEYEEGFADGGQATLDMVRELYGALCEKGDLSELEEALEGPEELSDAIEHVRRKGQDELQQQAHDGKVDRNASHDASPERGA